MSTPESRTTKRARSLVSDVRVSVAIPAELLPTEDDASQPTKRGLKALLTSSISPSADPAARILAFTPNGTVTMTTTKSNGGIPDEVSSQSPSFPEVVSDSGDELVITLEDATYRVGTIHRQTALSAIERAGQVGEQRDAQTDHLDVAEAAASDPAKAADADPAEAADADAPEAADTYPAEAADTASSVMQPEEVPDVRSESEEVQAEAPAPGGATLPGPKPTTNPGVVATASSATSGMTSANIAASLKRTLLTDEFGEIEIESRSRPTMQCQRLLRDRYVYLAVPGKALPRPGTDDPKGKFVLAFTDQGVMLFKPSRGNEALPRDVIGHIDATPIEFDQADYNAREGGWLTVGGRRYEITRPYVRSMVAYIAEHHDGPSPLR